MLVDIRQRKRSLRKRQKMMQTSQLPHLRKYLDCGVRRENTGSEHTRCCKLGKGLESLASGGMWRFFCLFICLFLITNHRARKKKKTCGEKFLRTTAGLHRITCCTHVEKAKLEKDISPNLRGGDTCHLPKTQHNSDY